MKNKDLEFKGTPGEWKIENTYTGLMIVDDMFNRLAHVYHTEDSKAKFNAKLIAAAPDLLEALQNAIKIVDLWLPDYTNDIPEEHKIEVLALGGMKQCFEKAIEKALGNEN